MSNERKPSVCSEDPAPGEADFRLTRRLAEGAPILHINMLDHVIVPSPGAGAESGFV
jgi:DNA repair protein RadC